MGPQILLSFPPGSFYSEQTFIGSVKNLFMFSACIVVLLSIAIIPID